MARILIVENDPTNAEAAGLICRVARHIVTIVTNGVEALLLLDALPFDLVLTDITMPRMDGITMTQLIRHSDRPYATIPIIGVTARTSPHDHSEMLAAGMDHLVTKPYRNTQLTDAITAVLAGDRNHVTLHKITELSPEQSPDPNLDRLA